MLMSRMLRMLLASLLDRFPLMARMALRWPLLAKRGSRQSGPLTNNPAHTPPQLPDSWPEPQGPAANPLAYEGAPICLTQCARVAPATVPTEGAKLLPGPAFALAVPPRMLVPRPLREPAPSHPLALS